MNAAAALSPPNNDWNRIGSIINGTTNQFSQIESAWKDLLKRKNTVTNFKPVAKVQYSSQKGLAFLPISKV